MTLKSMLLGCLVMALVTYACRVVSMVLLRKKIRNRFVQSFLYYIPYSVLAVMVFPGIFFPRVFSFRALSARSLRLSSPFLSEVCSSFPSRASLPSISWN